MSFISCLAFSGCVSLSLHGEPIEAAIQQYGPYNQRIVNDAQEVVAYRWFQYGAPYVYCSHNYVAGTSVCQKQVTECVKEAVVEKDIISYVVRQCKEVIYPG